MTYDAVADRFTTNAEAAKETTASAEPVIAFVTSLESTPHLDRLTAPLTA